MAIKGGDLIHVANRILVDRAQTAGPGQLTINKTKIYELGNYYSLANVLDIPDLSFSCESFDVSAEFEALLTGKTYNVDNSLQTLTITATAGTYTLTYGETPTELIAFDAVAATIQSQLTALTPIGAGNVTVTGTGPFTVQFGVADSVALLTANTTSLTGTAVVAGGTGVAMADGTAMKPAAAYCMDVASVFKPGVSAAAPYSVVGSVGIPYLQLESLAYKFGIAEMASQTATFKGDSVFYNPLSTFIQETAGTASAGQAIALAHPAVVYHGDVVNGSTIDGVYTPATRYILSVSLSTGSRLLPGADYNEATNTISGVTTVTVVKAVPTTTNVRVMYASTTPTAYPQLSHAAVTAIRPAAIKGRNVEVYIGGAALVNRWTSVQNVTLDWKVTLDKDEELGNSQVVSQSYDVPAVSGTITLKPRDYGELYAKICQVAGVTVTEVAGALTTVPLQLLILLHSPDTGVVLKTLEVPDARFTLPGFSGKAGLGSKMEVTFAFEGDSGDMTVYKGAKP